ncbi:MAG: MFS transporter [Coriobacteriales bacterium]|jgi:MFS family permease
MKQAKLKPIAFITGFGLVSCLMDIVYQGALSVQGPLLYSLGATAGIVGIVSGLGEATSLAGRLVSGPWADRTGKYWLFAIVGYAITALSVPAMGFAGSVIGVSLLIIFERFGKSLRTPSRDAMISHAAAAVGRGKGFAIHELMDQIGAVAGPLIVSAVLSATNTQYAPALGILGIFGLASIAVLVTVRVKVPDPRVYEQDMQEEEEKAESEKPADEGKSEKGERPRMPRLFWIYTAFCGLVLAGVGTFGVMSFHMVSTGLVSPALVTILYAIAQAVDAVFALVTGSLYDRIGTKALVVLPVVSLLIPVFVFTENFALMVTGVVLWGASLGIQESTMRAAVADIVPSEKRATSYGMFSVFLGIGSMVGGALIGLLYDVNVAYAIGYAVIVEVIAFILFLYTQSQIKHSAN